MPKRDILLIGDAHAKPGVSNDRFYWAGRYAADKKVDIIVDMGDWADMPSLSSYDVGKKSYEGRRYKQDVEAARGAREEFNRGLALVNSALARRHRARFRPAKIALGGNHDEGRITKVIDADPKLEGLIGTSDLGYREYGWEYSPYLEPIDIQGFTFSHYFASGVMGRPIGGEMPALSLVRKHLTSCVAAHSHLFDVAHRTRPNGQRVWGVVAGCYLDPSQWEDYAGPANKLWWRGLIILKGAENGDFDSIETVTVEELKNAYGRRSK